MAPSVRKTSAGRLDRRGKQFGIRNRPGCKPAVEVRLPGLAREKLWICVRDQISAERLGELVCRYIDGIEAFPPDHPDLPQLQEFRKKEFEAFVSTEFERRFPSVNQGPGSTDHHVYQEHGIFQRVAVEFLADPAYDFHHGKSVESEIMPTDVPESSYTHCVPVGDFLQNPLPSECEGFDLGLEYPVASLMKPEELRNPSTHVQTGVNQAFASTDHLDQGPATDQPTETELLEGAVQSLSSSDLQLTPEAAIFLNYEEPNLATRNEGMDGRSENEARRTDWLDIAWQLELENSRMEPSNCVEGDLIHGSIPNEIEEFMTLPINAPQSIFAETAESDNSQNVPPLASEALDVEWRAPVFQNDQPIEPRSIDQEISMSFDDFRWPSGVFLPRHGRGLQQQWHLDYIGWIRDIQWLLDYDGVPRARRWIKQELRRFEQELRRVEQERRAQYERTLFLAFEWGTPEYYRHALHTLELALEGERMQLAIERRQAELDRRQVELDREQAELAAEQAEIDAKRRALHDMKASYFALLILRNVYRIMDLQGDLLRRVAQLLHLVLSVITFSLIGCLPWTTPETIRFTMLRRRPTVGYSLHQALHYAICVT